MPPCFLSSFQMFLLGLGIRVMLALEELVKNSCCLKEFVSRFLLALLLSEFLSPPLCPNLGSPGYPLSVSAISWILETLYWNGRIKTMTLWCPILSEYSRTQVSDCPRFNSSDDVNILPSVHCSTLHPCVCRAGRCTSRII